VGKLHSRRAELGVVLEVVLGVVGLHWRRRALEKLWNDFWLLQELCDTDLELVNMQE
jgi:hypothetical protein